MAIAVHAALVAVVLRPEDPTRMERPLREEPPPLLAVEAIPVMPETKRPKRRSVVSPDPIARVRSPRTTPASAPTVAIPSVPSSEGERVRPMVEDVLYDDEGRARLPDEPIYAATKAPPDHYRMPGDGSEDDVFYRPPALAPQEDRIVFRWEPSRTLAGEWYDRLTRATSVRTAIPLGPKFSLVCGASLAGLGGACHIERNGGTGVIVHRSADPPPWEKARSVQCRGLREDLAAAEEPERIAWLLDRLVALCSGAPDPAGTETTTPGAGPGVGGAETPAG